MKRSTKGILIASGVAIIGAGAIAGTAIAERGEGGWKRGGHHGGEGRRGGGMRGMFKRMGREMTKEDFEAKARGRFASLDANSDGVIDAAEIESHIKARMDRRGSGRRGRGNREAQGENDDQGANRGRRGGRGMRGDADGDGKVTLEEVTKRVEERFAMADLNNDGQITDDDLPPRMRGRDILKGEGGMRGGRHHGRRGGHRVMRMIGRMIQADANKDGIITKAEVTAAAEARFKRRDLNGDGVIDQVDRDARRAQAVEYRVKRFIHRFGPEADTAAKVTREQFMAKSAEKFARLDSDGDGTIQRGEMRRMMHRGHGKGRDRGRGHDRGGHRGGSHRG